VACRRDGETEEAGVRLAAQRETSAHKSGPAVSTVWPAYCVRYPAGNRPTRMPSDVVHHSGDDALGIDDDADVPTVGSLLVVASMARPLASDVSLVTAAAATT